jgi:hypothetical protein
MDNPDPVRFKTWVILTVVFIILLLSLVMEAKAATHPVHSTSTCYLRKIGGSWVKICA